MITKRNFLKILALAGSMPALAQSRPKIIVSFSILAYFVQQIVGDKAEVISLVGFDEDAHHFHPRPNDIKAIKEGKLFLSHGSGFDSWAKKYNALEVTKTLVLENDPHIWHNAAYMANYALEIAKILSQKFPEDGAFFKDNVLKLSKSLFELDAEIERDLSQLKSRKAVTNHDAFHYFSNRYKIEFISPQGKLTGEPSAQAIARVINQIKKDNIKAIFIENMKSQKALEQISKETGVKIGGKLLSDSLSKEQSDYFSFMRHNVKVIKEALS